MKTIAFATLACSLAVNADITANLETYLAEYAQASGQENPSTNVESLNRKIPALLGPTLNLFNNYGCWCYFNDRVLVGKGQPVDAMDEQCQILHHGYECAVMDYEAATGESDCAPWEIVYTSGLSGAQMDESGRVVGLVENCEALNDNQCQSHACMVEGVFVISLFEILANQAYSSDYLEKNGFNYDESCVILDGNQTPERECCGDLPYRYPYKPIDRQCCGSKTYNPAIKECCTRDDGSLKLKLSCSELE